jgi:sugar/nucleoside kinase (ribokinase family)
MPEWDEVEYISDYALQQGGIIATAMAAVSRLGENAEFIGGIGDDDSGQYVLRSFKDANIKIDRVKIFKGETTAFSLVLVHKTSGKRTIIHYRGVQAKSDLEIPTIDLSGTRFLHLDGYWIDTALQIARQAKQRGITITLDPSSKLLRESEAEGLFRLIDYFMPSYSFAKRLTGETDPFEAAGKILRYGARAVIITRGEEGCFIRTQEEGYHLPAFRVSVVDTTGAGDTFHGAFVAGLSKGYELRQTAQFASAVAALKCTKLGGQRGIPTFWETQTFLKEQGIHPLPDYNESC